ncbi:hypothetical protein N7532_003308 [Penicillium argentinense]|uniref:RGS domain-containing protein n=1 Tax=Penicillium argentinense TaxID=1131581 RepID=A0A9W9KDV6_9EURO|nr:uncharacterized protein N7532_003308 [Penicillium argentinense]KAJ5102779.1 hypothetical protein N7532_003308 [Penicillium argentinense]
MGSELNVQADSKAELAINPVTIWWAVWTVVWTTAVGLGMWFLIRRRNSPILRIRGLGLSLSAVVLLHIYWILVQLGLMYGALAPGDAEFWIMGLYLPCGISLFHASNSRFLHVAKLQKKYVDGGKRLLSSSPEPKGKGSLLTRFQNLAYNTRILILVGAGMLLQISLTVLMWVISRKYHSSWGIPGTEVTGSEMAQKAEMGRGWEWWPGVVLQFFWAWVVAPVILWKSRDIHDTQGWRLQTIGCCLSNLHATPMWLIALYVPAFEVVNQYWLPPQWIAISIIAIEVFTVFLPCWEVVRHQSLRQETLDAIANWEKKVKGSNSEEKSMNTTSTMVDSMLSVGWSTKGSVKSDNSSSRDSILTMGALEYVLERNPDPLQKFSALNDFSGENIAFLTSIAEWKNSLPQAILDGPGAKDDNLRDLLREHFNRALHIYAEFISVHHAEFPLNISGHDLKHLESVFEKPTSILYGEEREVDPVSPFDKFTFDLPSPAKSEFSEKGAASSMSSIRERVLYWGDIPEEFCATIFDEAEKSIKYLVLTNTWPKFVRNHRRLSADSETTLNDPVNMV